MEFRYINECYCDVTTTPCVIISALIRFSPMRLAHSRRAYLIVVCAWLVHSISWFLPVIKLDGKHGAAYEPLRGWIAFRAALSPVLPYGDLHVDTWYHVVFSTLSAVTTLLFVLGSPWVAWFGSRRLQTACAFVAASAFIFNSYWYVLFHSDKALSIGYFLWLLSFALLSAGLFGLSSYCVAEKSGQANRAETN